MLENLKTAMKGLGLDGFKRARYTSKELMLIMDRWVSQHPWAERSWVPSNKITHDYLNILPNEQVCMNIQPFAIQQVRREIEGLVNAVIQLKDKRVMLEVGMGFVGGSHALWTHLFPKVVTLELDPNRIETFLKEQKPSFKQSVFIAGDSTRQYTVQLTRHVADNCDFLFIDGDHTRYGVETDWKNYEPLVRSGGIIAFHDTVLDSPPQIEVKSFVDALESGKVTGKPVKMYHERHSLCVGISYYYKA